MSMHDRLAKPQFRILGINSSPRAHTASAAWESPIIWCVCAINANNLHTIESVGAEPARLRFR